MTAEIIDLSEARQNRKDLQEEPEADPGKAETFRLLAQMILQTYLLKVAYEVLATPLTYAVIAHLKRVEQMDPFDRPADLTPFAF